MTVRQTALAAGVVLLIIAGAVTYFAKRSSPRGEAAVLPPRAIPIDARPPDGVRVRVEVLNATKIRGLAKHVSQHLREAGFDVLSVGGAREVRDSTLVIDRTGHPDWAWRVARALGGGATMRSTPDSSRYVDVTVLVGATWRPPPEPFHP
ncbi:MAG: LytR C-terminal domain-containing protein [Gemmatimonadota bacterium]|nr:LytR C-terminal domain-containing protein [Gemmatimonadota bacterium]